MRAGVQQGTQYLDLGCGAGLTAEKASTNGADVWGLGAFEALLDLARSRRPDVNFHLDELEDLPIGPNQFDVVSGFNAVQYAASLIKALLEAARVTTPDGMVYVATWGEPNGTQASNIITALRPLLPPPPPPPSTPSPFALSNTDVLQPCAKDCGADTTNIIDVEYSWFHPNIQTALKGLSSSGIAAKAITTVGQTAVDEAHVNAIYPHKRADGSFRKGARFKVLLARPSQHLSGAYDISSSKRLSHKYTRQSDLFGGSISVRQTTHLVAM